ncbi:hypothetical protein [Pantoea vagans]|uniref:hypothetical protein n=1 Tax=Pantoea vagans TaxID=470934 RepID=UPI003018860C
MLILSFKYPSVALGLTLAYQLVPVRLFSPEGDVTERQQKQRAQRVSDKAFRHQDCLQRS